MDQAEDLARFLESLDFTEYESRAYLSAVKLGNGRFSELATESDVPQQRIYDVVDELRERGLVEVHERTGGKEVVALPPEVALEDLKQRRVDEISATVDQAMEGLQQTFSRTETAEGFVTIVDHKDSATRHMRNAIEEAEWSLSLSLTPDLYKSLEAAIDAAADRGVRVDLLIQGEADEVIALDFDRRIDVRHRASADRLVASDRKYAVFQGVTSPAVSRPYLVTRNADLVVTFQRYRDEFWQGSRWIQHGSWSTRRYLTTRDVITEHRAALEDGSELEVYIEGIDTESGTERSWEGRIVDFELAVAEDADLSVVLPDIATLEVETASRSISVGGWDATLEDVAAYGIEIRP